MQRHRHHRTVHTRYNLSATRHGHHRHAQTTLRTRTTEPALDRPSPVAETVTRSDVHPIVLSARMRPAVLVDSGTVTATSVTHSDVHPIVLSARMRPSVLVASGTVTEVTHVEVPPHRVLLTAAPAPVAPAPTAAAPAPPKPYVLPGHALPLDTELTLLHNIAANPAGLPLSGDSLVGEHHPFDFGVSGTTLFTVSTSGNGRPAVNPETTIGGLFNVGTAPMRWLNFRFNYQFSHLTETFTSPLGQDLADISTNMQEFTGEYLIGGAPPTHRWSPFLGVGGGILRFSPGSGQPSAFTAQNRAAFLADPGVRIPTQSPHVTFRIDARILDYRAPDFNNPAVTNPHWTITVEPSLGILLRF